MKRAIAWELDLEDLLGKKHFEDAKEKVTVGKIVQAMKVASEWELELSSKLGRTSGTREFVLKSILCVPNVTSCMNSNLPNPFAERRQRIEKYLRKIICAYAHFIRCVANGRSLRRFDFKLPGTFYSNGQSYYR